jgi:hypothetical protein
MQAPYLESTMTFFIHPFPAVSKLAAVATLAVLTGCASVATPVVYNKADKRGAAERAQADIQHCRQQAEAVVGVNTVKAQKVGSSTAKRGAVEFVDKAVESIVNSSRNAMEKARGAAAGVMAGSLTSVVLNWNEPDSVYREYVDLCMKERGHKVLGWR